MLRIVNTENGAVRGIPAAAAAGIVAGDASLELEVISRVTEAQKAENAESTANENAEAPADNNASGAES